MFRLSHILWENILSYYGKVFPQNEGILSLLVGNLFPQYMGQSELMLIFNQDKGKGWYLTMRNVLKYYENRVNFAPKYGISYEKYHLEEMFLISYLFDNLLFSFNL